MMDRPDKGAFRVPVSIIKGWRLQIQLLEEKRPEQRRERAAERDATPELEVEPAALGDPAAHPPHEVQHVAVLNHSLQPVE